MFGIGARNSRWKVLPVRSTLQQTEFQHHSQRGGALSGAAHL